MILSKLDSHKERSYTPFAILLAAAFLLTTASCTRRSAATSRTMSPVPQPETATQAPPQTAAQAAPPPLMTFAQASRGAALHEFWGVIQSVNRAAGQIQVKSKKGVVKLFSIASDTKFTKGGAMTAVKFSDVKNGNHVRVHCAGGFIQRLHVYVL